MKQNGVLRGLAWTAVAVVPALFVYCWSVYYNSDYAMIGLMARAVLHHGERPLHVWTVGYQGVLFEVYAVAAALKFWGESPMVLNVVPWAVFMAFLALFRRAAHQALGATTSMMAVIFLVVSTPTLYGLALRTQPNYGEVFFLGTALALAYGALVRRHYVSTSPWDGRTWALCGLVGFLCGFGMYTYGQMAFFIAAIGLHGLLIAAREVVKLTPRQGSYRRLLAPWPLSVAAVIALLGFLSWVTDVHRFKLGSLSLGWEPFSTLRLGVKLWCAFLLLKALHLFWPSLWPLRRRLLLALLAVFAGALLGFAPELYGKLIIKVWTYDRSRMGVGFGEFVTHMKWALQAGAQLFNSALTPGIVPDAWGEPRPWLPRFVTVAAALAAAALALGGIALFLEKLSSFVKGRGARTAALELSPLALLPVPILLSFGLAPTVMGYPNTRYLTAALLAAALCSAQAVSWLMARWPRRVAAVWALVALILINNGAALGAKLAQHRVHHPLHDVISYLDAAKVTRGYAGFWDAYALTYLSQERIILEPTESNLNPRYGPLVAATPRVAFVGRGSQAPALGAAFVVIKTVSVGEYEVIIAERKPSTGQ